MITSDFRNAWRVLKVRRGYGLLSICVLGIGLGTVLFLLGLVNGFILEPLPFPHADRLVAIGYAKARNVGIGKMHSPEFMALKPELRSLDSIGVYWQSTASVINGNSAKHYLGCRISEQMLSLLGEQPVLGRGFDAADERPGAALTTLLGERVWRNDFNADADIVGRVIGVNGEPTTIIGVMPEHFAFPAVSEIWLPSRMAASDGFDVNVVARLGPSVSLAQARAELDTAAGALGSSLEGQRAGRHLVMKPLALSFVDELTRGFVWIMFAAGLLVLLLACVNVANLQLGQTLNRRRELAVRGALGADRSRLLREQLAQSLLLSLAATTIAVVLEQVGAHWLETMLLASGKAPAYYIHLGIDARMLGFAALAALLTTALAGLLPAWRASRTDVREALRDGDKGSRGEHFAPIAKGLVVVEIALTVVLLVGAGTFIHGLQRLLAVNPGSSADPTHILTASVDLDPTRYANGVAQTHFFANVIERLRTEPGVENATASNTIPGATLGSHEYIAALGQAKPAAGYQRAQLGIVDPYFADTYGVHLVEGRFFNARDQADTEQVAVIDQAAAAALWPGRDALGQRLLLHAEQKDPKTLTVIGVTTSLQLDGALEVQLPGLLVPMRQSSGQEPMRYMALAVRTRDVATSFVSRLAAIVHAVDAQTPVYDLRTQANVIAAGRTMALILTQVFTGIGLIALLLAAAGLYGVLAFAVAQRTREFGIRRAIGANSTAIIHQVARRLLAQIALGLLIGIGVALPWSGVLTDPRMHTRGYEVAVFVPVLVLIAVVAVLASLLPLWRALHVDPVIALRHE